MKDYVELCNEVSFSVASERCKKHPHSILVRSATGAGFSVWIPKKYSNPPIDPLSSGINKPLNKPQKKAEHKPVPCYKCGGKGSYGTGEPCSSCYGSGKLTHREPEIPHSISGEEFSTSFDPLQTLVECYYCDGTGRTHTGRECKSCLGRGRTAAAP